MIRKMLKFERNGSKEEIISRITIQHCWPLVKITWMDAMDGDTGWVRALNKMLKGQIGHVLSILDG